MFQFLKVSRYVCIVEVSVVINGFAVSRCNDRVVRASVSAAVDCG